MLGEIQEEYEKMKVMREEEMRSRLKEQEKQYQEKIH